MPTLAIHQHKRLIRWQAAHAVRPCENRTVIACEALDIKRRHLLAQDIGYVRRTLIEQFVRTDDIDRGRGLGRDRKEHTSELQSLMRISYAVFCWKKKIYDDKVT